MKRPRSIQTRYVISCYLGVRVLNLYYFMNNEELSDDAVQHEPNEKDPIKITNGTFRYIITNKVKKK